MKKLLIVESPAKIKTIGKFLGKDFLIMSTLGHVKDLPQRKLGIHMDDQTISLDYTVLEDKDKVITDIRKAAKGCDAIYLAPDPDREGEIIAWHVANEVAPVVKKDTPILRVAFNEITKPAVEAALAHPQTINEERVAAQQARRVLDRWVGYEVSPVLWKKVAKGLSAGRVQSVALKCVCTREEAIRSFKPEEYWSIHARFERQKASVVAELVQVGKKKPVIDSEEKAQALVKDVSKGSYTVAAVKDSKRLRSAPPPFMTSTLQQAAYNQLGLSVQTTMQIAQKLYEGLTLSDPSAPVALITYMRTDSLRVSDVALKQVRSYIKESFGDDYLPAKSLAYSKGKAQDAHEAIRPIDVSVTPQTIKPYVDKKTFEVYQLIWNRFVACQMKAAEYAQRQVTITDETHVFKVTGSTLLFDGFLKVYNEGEEEAPAQGPDVQSEGKKTTSIPASFVEGADVTTHDITPKQHFTQPPPRYTEASLVKELEKEGIGRPSTYATILKTIQARSYTTLDEKKRFVPTELGMMVTKLLEQNMPQIMDIGFTAEMEENLDKIAHGELDRDTLLRTFYANFSVALEKFGGTKTGRVSEETGLACAREGCEGKLLIKFGKSGPFVGCSTYPECPFTSNFERTEEGEIKLVEKPVNPLLDETCPRCSRQLQERTSRYGTFIACSGYPECTYIKQQESSFDCPGCGQAKLSRRNWKGKIFWGCTRYPECKFSISGDIADKPCPRCKKPYLLSKTDRNGIVTLICSDKECGYKLKSGPEDE